MKGNQCFWNFFCSFVVAECLSKHSVVIKWSGVVDMGAAVLFCPAHKHQNKTEIIASGWYGKVPEICD